MNAVPRIPLSRPSITDAEVALVTDAIQNGWGDRCYDYIHRFEQAFADHVGVRHAIATSSCTGALHMGMAALGGWALVLAALAVLWRYHAVSRKQFGGITGDLAGWFLQKAELWMLAALCACQWGGLL